MSASTHDTLVVGAGVSGLTYAYARLRHTPRERLLVLEAGARVGGLVRTVQEQDFRFEEGPEALPSTAREVRELCAELEVPLHEAPPAAAKRYLLLDGKLQEVPAAPEGMATSRILSFGAKLRLLAEGSVARDVGLDDSIAEFARHRFGAEALERIVEPLVAGIHAGKPEELSLRACFPEVVRLVEEHGSISAALKARAARKSSGERATPLGGSLIRPRAGMERLAEALANRLEGRVRLDVRVVSLAAGAHGFRMHTGAGESFSATRVVLALPLAIARELLTSVAPDAAAALRTMACEGLASVVHAYPRSAVTHALDGFGYLVPRGAGGQVLGTLFSSTIDPSCAPADCVLLRTLLGGARSPSTLELDESTLREEAVRATSSVLGIRGAPLLARVARYPAVIPRFDLAHPTRLATLGASLPSGLTVLGNFTQGLGLARLVKAAREAALL